MQTDFFVRHGYSEPWLGDTWRKARLAFKFERWGRFGLLPLKCDGRDDSICHPVGLAGPRQLEFVRRRGGLDAVPLARTAAHFAQASPAWASQPLPGASFMADVWRKAG